MQWRAAKSLLRLREQINSIYPNRSKISDGLLGDTAHSKRKSDHNPGPDGVVKAIDLTHDPVNGLDCGKLLQALIDGKDRRISYMIYNGEIVSGTGGTQPWKRRRYTGSNKHAKHIHISVTDAWKDDGADWKLSLMPNEKQIVLKEGASGKYVEDLQLHLTLLGYKPGSIDGRYGGATKTAVEAFQRDNNLTVDGWAGSVTLIAIGEALKKRETAPKIAAAKSEATKAEKTANGGSTLMGGLGIAGLGSSAISYAQGADWQNIVAFAAVGTILILGFLLARKWLIPALKEVKEQLS